MKKDDISKIIGSMNSKHIEEAASYTPKKGKVISIKDLFIKAPLAATIVILLLAGTIAYTAANRTNWSSSIHFDDGSEVQIIENAVFKKIPDDMPKTGEYDNMTPMTHEKIEALLGFDILHYENAQNTTVNYSTDQNSDGRIARVDLWWPRILSEGEEGEKSLNQSVHMLNEGADTGYVLAFEEGLDAMGEKVLLDEIRIEQLDVNAVCYTSGDDSDRITVTFVYDNIMYDFTGHGYTLEEILSVIKELK